MRWECQGSEKFRYAVDCCLARTVVPVSKAPAVGGSHSAERKSIVSRLENYAAAPAKNVLGGTQSGALPE